MSDLIKKIEAARKKSDKQALVKLGADELGVDLDASKTTAVLAEELLAIIEERGGDTPEQNETGGETKESAEPSSEGESSQASEGPATEGKQDPAPAPETKSAAPKAQYKGKQLKNTKNGRLFPWTAALAKKRDMTEV